MTHTLQLHEFQAIRGRALLADPVSLKLTSGAILALVGPNAAGKSSLLAAIAGTGIGRAGTVVLDGDDLHALSARERAARLSFLAQTAQTPGEFRVAELVRIGVRAHPGGDAAERTGAALRALHIEDLRDRRIGTLSGGQRQLANLARVVAQDTPFIVLDEPHAALDLGHQLAVERIVQQLAAAGRIVIVAVHELAFARNIATHVLLLGGNGGVHVGPPDQVLSPSRIADVYRVGIDTATTGNGHVVFVPTREMDSL